MKVGAIMEDTNVSKVNICIMIINSIAGVISYIAVFAAICAAVFAMVISVYTMIFTEPTIYEATVVSKQEKIFMTRTGGHTTPTIYVDVDGCILDTSVSDDIYTCIEVDDTVAVKVWDVFGEPQMMRLHNADDILSKGAFTE